MEENKLPYKDTDGVWRNPDGSKYPGQSIKECGELGIQAPWLVGKGFDANPENMANSGRGKTSLVSLAKKWKEEGAGTEVTKKQIQEVYKQMLSASRREIEKVAKDKDAPLAVTVMAESLLDPKTRAKTLQDTQVWLFGKEAEEVKITTSVSTEGVDDNLRDKIREAALRKIS